MQSRFQIITHANGSHTLRDTVVGQEMHSRVGPWIEAKTLYAESSRIGEKLDGRGKLTLHDVGMGTAANVIASLEAIENRIHPKSPAPLLTVESFELHLDGLRFALAHAEQFPFLTSYRKQLLELLEKREIQFILPRSRVTVRWRLWEKDYFSALEESALPDLIFYDFYSLKAEPHLWSEAVFKKLHDHLSGHETELYTYSAATPVRLSLLLAGFYVGYGARTEMKTETTVATTQLNLLQSPLGQNWLDKLSVSSSIESEELRERGILAFKNFLHQFG